MAFRRALTQKRTGRSVLRSSGTSGISLCAAAVGRLALLLLPQIACALKRMLQPWLHSLLKMCAFVPRPTVAKAATSKARGITSRVRAPSQAVSTRARGPSAKAFAKTFRCLIVTTTDLRGLILILRKAQQAALSRPRHSAPRNVPALQPAHIPTTKRTSGALQGAPIRLAANQASQMPSWLVAPLRPPSPCMRTFPTMSPASTTTLLVTWKAAMPCASWAGALMAVRSIGRLRTAGILIGVRKGTSASKGETTKSALRIR